MITSIIVASVVAVLMSNTYFVTEELTEYKEKYERCAESAKRVD